MIPQTISVNVPPMTDQSQSKLAALWSRPSTAPLILLALCVAVFAPELFGSADRAISSAGNDTDMAFLYWRQMGYDSLRHGHLQLWNPYVAGGAPFLGGWQAQMLYPLNLTYLVLPLVKAIDFEFALHVYLAGLFMCLWAQHKGFGTAAALVAGTMTMFGAPFFLHVYAGHLSPIDAMAWAPLILMSVDTFLEKPSLKWGLIGSGALALQILAGHPQTVFMTMVTALVFTALKCVQAPARLRLIPVLALVVLGGSALAAAQLGAGFAAASVGTRHGAVPYYFASSLSFAPENLLTVFAPNLFGKCGPGYWGESYLWEMSAYMGVGGLVLAKFGVWKGTHPDRAIWSIAAVIFIVVALAGHTPLFPILYKFAPGFNKFRSHSKFFYDVLLFSSLIAAAGVQRLIDDPRPARAFACVLAAIAVLVLATGAGCKSVAMGNGAWATWNHAVPWNAIMATSYKIDPRIASDAGGVALAHSSGDALLTGGALVALLACLIALASTRPRAIAVVLAVAVLELAVYARSSMVTFPVDKPAVSSLAAFRAANPGDYRMLFNWASNDAVAAKAYDVWGYDPSTVGRWAELMARLQGIPASEASTYLTFDRYLPLYRLLRCRYFLWKDASGGVHVMKYPGEAPHVFLAGAVADAPTKDAAFELLTSKGFNTSTTAILERRRSVQPSNPARDYGTAGIEEHTTDGLTIDADIKAPCVLVLTDAYCDGWTATPLDGGQNQVYDVQPADYALIGIPLRSGVHRFRLEYRPKAWTMGRVISISALALYALAWTALALTARRRKPYAEVSGT